MAATIGRLRVLKSVRTPLADAITQGGSDLSDVTDSRILVVVSDGLETCGGNPARAVRLLRATGVDVTLNIAGLELDRKTRRAIEKLVDLGGGTYFDARDEGHLERAMTAVTSAPFEVYDATGEKVASGIVNGQVVELEPGTYRVVALTDPRVKHDAVVVGPDESVTLQLG